MNEMDLAELALIALIALLALVVAASVALRVSDFCSFALSQSFTRARVSQ